MEIWQQQPLKANKQAAVQQARRRPCLRIGIPRLCPVGQTFQSGFGIISLQVASHQ